MTHRTMARRAAVLIAGLATLAACSAGTDDDADDTTAPPLQASTTSVTNAAANPSAAPTTSAESSATTVAASTTGAPATTAAPGGAPLGGCLAGEWQLTELAPAAEAVGGLSLSGRATGITVTFDELNWRLDADDSVVQAIYQDVTADLDLDGEASGLVGVDGDTIGFTVDRSDGEVELYGQPAPFTFDQALVALLPSGMGQLACAGSTATITSETGVVTLTQAGGGTPTATSAPAATSAPGGGGATAPIVIIEGGLTETYACGGQTVTVTGGGNDLTFTGDCPSLTVTGGGNTVHVERVDTIEVTGSANAVTWTSGISGAEPAVADTGVGNIIEAS